MLTSVSGIQLWPVKALIAKCDYRTDTFQSYPYNCVDCIRLGCGVIVKWTFIDFNMI